jgi:hypothetical protein
VQHIRTRSRSVLSKYFGAVHKRPIFVVAGAGAPVPLEHYTPLYARYQKPALLERVYVDPQDRERAKAILSEVIKASADKQQPTAPSADA